MIDALKSKLEEIMSTEAARVPGWVVAALVAILWIGLSIYNGETDPQTLATALISFFTIGGGAELTRRRVYSESSHQAEVWAAAVDDELDLPIDNAAAAGLPPDEAVELFPTPPQGFIVRIEADQLVAVSPAGDRLGWDGSGWKAVF